MCRSHRSGQEALIEDIADALGVEKRDVAAEVATRVSTYKSDWRNIAEPNLPKPPLRAGAAYEDIADALGVKRDPNLEVVKVITVRTEA